MALRFVWAQIGQVQAALAAAQVERASLRQLP
jgi:hypothetical protein